jgi:hypothetical protein
MTTDCEKRAGALLLPGDTLEKAPDEPWHKLQVPGLPTTQFRSVKNLRTDQPATDFVAGLDYTTFATNPFGIGK